MLKLIYCVRLYFIHNWNTEFTSILLGFNSFVTKDSVYLLEDGKRCVNPKKRKYWLTFDDTAVSIIFGRTYILLKLIEVSRKKLRR